MALETYWYPVVLIANAILGVVLVLGVFKFMEKHVSLGAIGGTLLGAGLVYAQATVGEQELMVTVAEMKLLVIAAALGAVLGVVGTVLMVKPELQ